MQYTQEVLRTLINAGLTEKPDGVSEQDWESAKQPTLVENVNWQMQEPQTSVPAVMTVSQPTVVQAAQAPADAFQVKESYSFDDFKSSGMAVDSILSIRSGVPCVSKKEVLKKAFKATLLFAETKVKQTIKCETPDGQLHYFSTYGGGVDSRDGTPFSDKVAYCRMHDPKAFVYPSADLVFIAEEDLVDPEGKVVAPKGTKMGHSTSATSRKSLEEFYSACGLKGIDTKTAEVPVLIGFKTMTNKQGTRNWCIVTVELA